MKFSVIVLGLALASVPIFSFSEGLSLIPQGLAFLAVVVCFFDFDLSRLHPSMACYLGLTLFFGIMLPILSPPQYVGGLTEAYFSFAKVVVLCVACNMIIRSRRDLITVFLIFALACPIAFVMNYHDIVQVAELTRRQEHMVGASGLYYARFAGTFANANTAGIFTMSAIAVAAACATVWGRRKITWLLLLVVLPTASIIAVYSGSRKVMLGLPAIAMIAGLSFAVRQRHSFFAIVKALVVSSLLVVCAAAVLVVYSPHAARLDVLFSKGASGETSADGRLQMIFDGINLWLKSPLWGNGYSSFTYLSTWGMYSHSMISEMLCNGGIIAMGLWVLIFVFLLRDLRHQLKLADDPRQRPFLFQLAGFVAVIAGLGVFMILLSDRFVMPLLACIAGYVQQCTINERMAAATHVEVLP